VQEPGRRHRDGGQYQDQLPFVGLVLFRLRRRQGLRDHLRRLLLGPAAGDGEQLVGVARPPHPQRLDRDGDDRLDHVRDGDGLELGALTL